MSYHFSAIPHFRELFDCPTYYTHKSEGLSYTFKIYSITNHVLFALKDKLISEDKLLASRQENNQYVTN